MHQGVDVVSVAGHDVAVFVLVKKGYRQPLHVGKHFISDLLLHLLGQDHHQQGEKVVGDQTDGVNAGHEQNSVSQGAKVRALLLEHGRDVAVDNLFNEQGADNGSRRADDHGDQGNDQSRRANPVDVFQQAGQGLHL